MDLPQEIWLLILKQLRVADVSAFARTCRYYATVARTPYLWWELCRRDFPEIVPNNDRKNLQKLYRIVAKQKLICVSINCSFGKKARQYDFVKLSRVYDPLMYNFGEVRDDSRIYGFIPTPKLQYTYIQMKVTPFTNTVGYRLMIYYEEIQNIKKKLDEVSNLIHATQILNRDREVVPHILVLIIDNINLRVVYNNFAERRKAFLSLELNQTELMGIERESMKNLIYK